MIEMRRAQLSFGDGLISAEVDDLRVGGNRRRAPYRLDAVARDYDDAVIEQLARNRIKQVIGLQHDVVGGRATGFGHAH